MIGNHVVGRGTVITVVTKVVIFCGPSQDSAAAPTVKVGTNGLHVGSALLAHLMPAHVALLVLNILARSSVYRFKLEEA